jgi:hypothetical protein
MLTDWNQVDSGNTSWKIGRTLPTPAAREEESPDLVGWITTRRITLIIRGSRSTATTPRGTLGVPSLPPSPERPPNSCVNLKRICNEVRAICCQKKVDSDNNSWKIQRALPTPVAREAPELVRPLFIPR